MSTIRFPNFALDPHAFSDSPATDSIRTEYHDTSGRPTKVDHFEDYCSHPNTAQAPGYTVNSKPWWPFLSRTDFEFAEIALEAAMTKKQIEKMINLFRQCSHGRDSFNLTNYNDVRSTWEAASQRHTPVPI